MQSRMTHMIDPPRTPHPSPLQPQPRRSPAESPMVYVYEQPKWEYKIVLKSAEDTPLTEQDLNSMGADGWELVGVVRLSRTVQLFFKRSRR
jgi:hypothetical protein